MDRAVDLDAVALSVVRGDADDDDIAAVVAALTLLARTGSEPGSAAADGPHATAARPRSPLDPWTARARSHPGTGPTAARWT